jgi:hypothetical protein
LLLLAWLQELVLLLGMGMVLLRWLLPWLLLGCRPLGSI